MADYIYLLENRLSAAQRSALRAVRDVARAKNLTVFLVGGAVRDLTSGSPVRDLDVVVLGNALKLKKDLEKAGATIDGEVEAAQALFTRFPGQVRVEVASTMSVTYPKPGKAVMRPATILDDLRRRDFTANAMALSLNEGSYGLLMDPLNGVADIENRQLRLVSNYGFIEDPVRMIRAARLMARLGWTLDEKTQTRYETGKAEEYISALSDYNRGYEAEEIFHEEDPLRVMRGLEAEGWMKHLVPFWSSAKANVPEVERLSEVQVQLQMQGVQADTAVAIFPLLTAKLSAKEIATLKELFPRQGFVAEIDALESSAKQLAADLGGKEAAQPSQAWRLITSARPETVLQVAFSTKNPALQAKFKSFYTEWPQARQKMPYTLMQEMRIVPELPVYEEVLEKLFFELMDGRLTTQEEIKAFLEPYSPPAPPPPVSMRRFRQAKKDAKPAKSRAKKAPKVDDDGEELELPDDVELPDAAEFDSAGDDSDTDDVDGGDDSDGDDEDSDVDDEPAPPRAAVKVAKKAAVKVLSAPVPPVAAKGAGKVQAAPPPVKAARKAVPVAPAPGKSGSASKVPAKKVVARKAPAAPPAKVAAPAKKAPAKAVPPAKKAAPVKVVAKAPAKKTVVKAPAKAAAPAKKAVPAKKVAAKGAKRR